MAGQDLCFGIPNIPMKRVGGGAINPAHFVGHELIIFFCPAGPEAACREIDDYSKRAPAFVAAGAWVLGVVQSAADSLPQDAGQSHVPIVIDQDGAGWPAFESLLDANQRSDETGGGAFLFHRGGCLAQAWAGAGHAEEALRALELYRPAPARPARGMA